MEKPSVNKLREIICQIKVIIMDLNKQKIYELDKRENYFFTHFPDIMNQYPFLVSQLCSGTDTSMLDTMLSHIEQMETGKKTENEVDVIVGEELASAFLTLNPNQQ